MVPPPFFSTIDTFIIEKGAFVLVAVEVIKENKGNRDIFCSTRPSRIKKLLDSDFDNVISVDQH